MIKLASAARIIQKAQTLPGETSLTVSHKTDLFTTEELFGVKQDQYLKNNRSRVLADMETLFAKTDGRILSACIFRWKKRYLSWSRRTWRIWSGKKSRLSSVS